MPDSEASRNRLRSLRCRTLTCGDNFGTGYSGHAPTWRNEEFEQLQVGHVFCRLFADLQLCRVAEL
eukprot:3072904-Rhodomonas_salina.1